MATTKFNSPLQQNNKTKLQITQPLEMVDINGNASSTKICDIRQIDCTNLGYSWNTSQSTGKTSGNATLETLIQNINWLMKRVADIEQNGSTPQVTTYTIIWDNNGATTDASDGSASVEQGQSVTIPTTNPKRKYDITWNKNNNNGSDASGGTESVTYSFKGWYTAASGGTQVTANTIPTGNVTYYAQWNEQNPTSITIPTTEPTYSGYTFKGWYTKTSGGTQVTSGTRSITANTTFYAQWKAVQSTTYYWYVGTTQPTDPTDSAQNTGLNKWTSLGTELPTSDIQVVKEDPTYADHTWYIAAPTDANFVMYNILNTTPELGVTKLNPINIGNVSYDVWKTNSEVDTCQVYLHK